MDLAAPAHAGCLRGGRVHRLRRHENAIDPQVKAATFTSTRRAPGSEVDPAAVDKVRPEARQLIDDVDGMVTVSMFTEPDGSAVGTAHRSPGALRCA